VAIALSLVFVIQAILSWFVDVDADVDFGDSLDASDFISFLL